MRSNSLLAPSETLAPCSRRGPEQPAASPPPRRGRIGIVLKLTIAFALTLAVLEGVILITGHHHWREILKNQIHAHLSAVAASRREMVESSIRLLRQQVLLNTQRGEFRRFLIATDTAPAESDRISSQTRLQRIVDDDTVFSACLVDASGRVRLSSNSEEVGADFSKDPAFIRGLASSYVDLPRRAHGRLEVIASAPVKDHANSVGVLLIRSALRTISAPLEDITGLGETGEVVLVMRKDDLVQFIIPPRGREDITSFRVSAAPGVDTLLGKKGGFVRIVDYRRHWVLAAATPMGYEGWFVVAKTDEAEAYAPIDRTLRTRLVYGSLICLVGTLVAYALARRFAGPVRRLSEAAAEVARGDYRRQVPVTSNDELGDLSASFNEMTKAICARRQERDEAEAALRLAHRRKDDFLAILGHELRNPVGAIAAAVLVWKEAGDDPVVTKSVQEVVERQTGNLKRLVDDLLDVARIVTGKIELRRKPVAAGELIRHAAEAARPMIEERGHQLEIILPSADPIWVDADATRIEQVLTNLLINAAKYTPDGGRIGVNAHLDGDVLEIVVSDTGIGLAPETLNHIFDLFTQADTSLHRTDGGLGVGLSLSRELVSLHGGSVRAQSEGPNRGAEFIVRLPTIPAPALPETPRSLHATDGPARRVLLVDDNKDSIRLLGRLIERRGHQVRLAFDGREALEAARDFSPEVLVVDLGLPEIDGYELCRRLRDGDFAGALIVALSGYAQESDRARARDAGFDRHFAKPVDFDELAALIVEGPSVDPPTGTRREAKTAAHAPTAAAASA